MTESDYDFFDKLILDSVVPIDLCVGRILKTRVRIDTQRTQIGRTALFNQDIVALGWWSQTTKNLEWAQNEWTTGWIRVKTEASKAKVTVPGHGDFSTITTALWRFAVMPKLYDLANKLDAGKRFSLCGLKISGEGISISSPLRGTVFVPWENVGFSAWDGKLVILENDKNRVLVRKSYRRADNLPVLEGLLNAGRRRVNYNLSWADAVWPVE